MTLTNATRELSRTVDALWDAVSELVLICFEDQPGTAGLAATDQLAEQVSELQAEVAAARELCARRDQDPVDWLPLADLHLRRAGLRFSRDIQAAGPVKRLHAATRRAGGQWPAWHRTVQVSAERVNGPLDDVAAAMNTCWQDTCQLLARVQPAHVDGTAVDRQAAPDGIRRIS